MKLRSRRIGPQGPAGESTMPPSPSPQNTSITFGSISPYQIQSRRSASAPAPDTLVVSNAQDTAPDTVANSDTHSSLPRTPDPQAPPPLLLPPPPPPPPSGIHPAAQINLLWQTMHLTNVLTSQLSAYLSLETLDRNARKYGWTVPVRQTPILEAQMAMMVDSFKNLAATVETLTGTALHPKAMASGSYRCLLDATRGIASVMGIIRNGGLEKTPDEVEFMRKAHDQLTELCHGNAHVGLEGWRGCWDEVKAFTQD